MSDPVGAPKECSPEQLGQFIFEQEELFGPIVAIELGIENGDDVTALSFDWNGETPTQAPVVREKVGGQSIGPAGVQPVCEGEAYLFGVAREVGVFR